MEQTKEEILINQCNSSNQIEKIHETYGYTTVHKIGDKIVTLKYLQYSDGPDDYYDEIHSIKIEESKELPNEN